ncbi:hypothetical protein ILUMI_20861 [Ignelater luminosus]|uniref:Integrase catalytic domain-containing protein n=1 Tax=Ignelater luminosus TaxID=2038154 RepID=A0A8K0G480_IGNLU|nr:hypothetical protein ILUMI_20861 [Ignelater luminosus]
MADSRGISPIRMDGNVAENWRIWRSRFENYLKATEIRKKTAEVQCAQLLHLIGKKGFKIYKTFDIKEDEKDKLEVLLNKFDAHFLPKENLTYERYLFMMKRQQEGQILEDFITELVEQAQKCKLGDLHDGLIKCMITCGVRNEAIREKLLRNDSLMLEEAIEQTKIIEKSQEQSKQMGSTGEGDSLEVIGQCMLACKKNNKKYNIDFYIVQSDTSAILGLNSCLTMNVIKKVDSVSTNANCKDLVKIYKDVFVGIGCLSKPYHIKLKNDAKPVAHPTRRVPLALMPQLKNCLDQLVKQNVIEKVEGAADWVNSLIWQKNLSFGHTCLNELKQVIDFCYLCQKYSNSQAPEPLRSHDLHVLPWSKVACDRHGIPLTLVTDGGPQSTSDIFKKFSKEWEFTHIFSSPTYAKSNGMAERNVQTAKNIDERKDIYLALLIYRNMPISGNYSPSQVLMSRKLRSIVPTNEIEFQPKVIDVVKYNQFLNNNQQVQERTFDHKCIRELSEIQNGTKVVVQLKPKGNWIPAVIVRKLKYRTYVVKTNNGSEYVRNRIFIKVVPNTKLNPCLLDSKTVKREENENSKKCYIDLSVSNETLDNDVSDNNEGQSDIESSVSDNNNVNHVNPLVIRTGRVVKPPDRLNL